MPVCPRCGKVLCNEQSLMYHLKKKVRCDSLKCMICGEIFTTKWLHSMCQDTCLKQQNFSKQTQTSPQCSPPIPPEDDRGKINVSVTA